MMKEEQDELMEEVLAIVEEHLDQSVMPDTLLESVCDELDIIELIMAMEEEFDIEIYEDEEELVKTPRDLVRIVSSKLSDEA